MAVGDSKTEIGTPAGAAKHCFSAPVNGLLNLAAILGPKIVNPLARAAAAAISGLKSTPLRERAA